MNFKNSPKLIAKSKMQWVTGKHFYVFLISKRKQSAIQILQYSKYSSVLSTVIQFPSWGRETELTTQKDGIDKIIIIYTYLYFGFPIFRWFPGYLTALDKYCNLFLAKTGTLPLLAVGKNSINVNNTFHRPYLSLSPLPPPKKKSKSKPTSSRR